METAVFLLLGSNMDDPAAKLEEARDLLGTAGLNIRKVSSIFRTSPWGIEDQNDFLNQVLQVETILAPESLLENLLDIEKAMGRKRFRKWGPRIIDIDILFYGKQVISNRELKVPHPELQNRLFTLKPLSEIAPDLVHPVLKKTVSQLLEECQDDGQAVIEDTSASL